MTRLLISGDKPSEGFIFNKMLESKMIRRNKNMIFAVTGSVGSGKSYICLRIAELWYEYYFKKPFPIEHCCFNIDEIISLLNSKELKRGDIIILEEAGVNLNSLDFQNKISKLFTFVLQSFRSMNLCLILNLPVLTMLNKSARLLLHANFITTGIDFQAKTSKLKPLFHQLNQQTGKVYPKYPRIRYEGSMRTFERFNYKIPSEDLINIYEERKKKFVSDLIEGFSNKLTEEKQKHTGNLTEGSMQPNIWALAIKYQGKWKTQKELIALFEKEYNKEVNQSQFSRNVKNMCKKGYNIRDFIGI